MSGKPSPEARRLAINIQQHDEWPYWEIAERIDALAAARIQHEGWRPKYRVKDEHGQTIAITQTKWTAEKLIEGIKTDGGLTSQLGSWSIELLNPPPQQDGKEEDA